ncbi:MAG: hypothetical protein J6W28_04575, partial [Clostridia bacterium]|nr:hypothetical protein [Clostridia bacterium]
VGLFLMSHASRLFTYGSGHSIFEWTKNGKTVGECEGIPNMITDTTDMVNVGLKFTELYNAKGVYNFPDVNGSAEDCIYNFINNKAIMSTANLGEMESTEMRNAKFTRGILPFPRYSREIEDLTTLVHDQAEVSVILNNAKSFAMASAYLQYINEESTEILSFYYDDVLKFKYNESRGARNMIDLVNETVTTPFEASMVLYVFSESKLPPMYSTFANDAKKNSGTTLRSTYDAARQALQTTLEGLYDDFLKLQ